MNKVNIKNPLGIGQNVELAGDIAGLRAGRKDVPLKKNASVIRANLKNGEIGEGQLQELFDAARNSKTYQRNKEKYQFTIVSSSKGSYLALKQQGLWSKFKSLFPWTQQARQERRASAAETILRSLGRYELAPDRMTLAEARSFQRRLIEEEVEPLTVSELAPFEGPVSGQLLSAEGEDPHQTSQPISDGYDEQVGGSPKESFHLKPDENDPYEKTRVGKNSIEPESHPSQGLPEESESDDGDEGQRESAKQSMVQQFDKQYMATYVSTMMNDWHEK